MMAKDCDDRHADWLKRKAASKALCWVREAAPKCRTDAERATVLQVFLDAMSRAERVHGAEKAKRVRKMKSGQQCG